MRFKAIHINILEWHKINFICNAFFHTFHNSSKALDYLKQIQNVYVLGSLKAERLAMFSILIRNEQSDLYLHPNFVNTLLNDLFGIQAHSGCAFAEPYAQYLLGIDDELARIYKDLWIQKDKLSTLLKPGFTRFSLAFFFDQTKVDFILRAVRFICEFGWMFLPLYKISLEGGKFFHKNQQVSVFLNV